MSEASETIEGRATAEGTAGFAERAAADNRHRTFRTFGTLSLSTLGIGTYLGQPNDEDDDLYAAAIDLALERGVNVVDTAINYRCQRSERAVGHALRSAIAAGKVTRDQVLVASKAGFLPFDRSRPADPAAYLRATYVDTGLAPAGEIASGVHCMAPAFLANQIERSLQNLGLETIDVYYLHNPETQLEEVSPAEFRKRLVGAFAALEKACEAGSIGCYGAATWNGFRRPPSAGDHLGLELMLDVAREVGGADHRFRMLQLPVNLAMPEAATVPTQGRNDDGLPLLNAAADAGLYVMSSGSILQGRFADNVPEAVARAAGPGTGAQCALQVVRSLPGMGTALVGMKNAEHVRENTELGAREPMDPKAALKLLG